MHQIYDQSFGNKFCDKTLSRPVAKLTAIVARRPWLQRLVKKTTGAFVIDVEKDVDIYRLFAAVTAEVVDQNRLSPSQRFAITNDPRYRDAGTLYLVTMVSAPDSKTGKSRQREFLFDDEAYAQLGVEKPSSATPVGTGKEVIGAAIYDIGTKGQKAFAAVPRSHTVERKEAPELVQKIDASLVGPDKPSRRMKIGFMDPKVPK